MLIVCYSVHNGLAVTWNVVTESLPCFPGRLDANLAQTVVVGGAQGLRFLSTRERETGDVLPAAFQGFENWFNAGKVCEVRYLFKLANSCSKQPKQ